MQATKRNAMPKPAQFSKSKVSNLFRHRGGNYYAITKVSGRVIRRSLETDDFNTAKIRLPSVLEEIRGARNASEAGTLGKAIHDEAHRLDPEIKESTRHYYQQVSTALEKLSKSQPLDILALSVARVTVAELRSLLDAFAASSSPTRYNGALALLRRTFDRAIESGHVAKNTAQGFKRMKPKTQKHDLPTVESFAEIVEEIISQKKTHSKAVAMAVELLAYTGLRISEGQRLKWRDIKKDHLLVRTAKNDDLRQVPLIPAASGLLERMRKVGIPTGPDDPVMLVKSPRIALEGACKRLGVDHLRVHDLRHIFATRCIEAGVDMPTLASWLGHKDGGVLAMQVYGHLCKKHSTAMAGRVKA
jgi:integrase